MPNLWLYLSLSAAACWGFGYALSEKVLKAGVPTPVLMRLTGSVILILNFFVAYFSGQLKSGFQTMTADWRILAMALVIGLTILAGNYMIFTSVQLKNATLANMIEIAYPFFTFLFAWLLFRDVQLNWATAIGGLLIFCGVGIIYWKN